MNAFFPCKHRSENRCLLNVIEGHFSIGRCIGCAKFERGRAARPTASKTPDLRCIHRGEQIREESCTSCGGNVRIKVFACGKHGDCQLGHKATGVRSCATCRDRQPSDGGCA